MKDWEIGKEMFGGQEDFTVPLSGALREADIDEERISLKIEENDFLRGRVHVKRGRLQLQPELIKVRLEISIFRQSA